MNATFRRHVLIALAICVLPPFALKAQKGASWSEFLGGPESAHYSPSKQLTPRNVDKLEVAWSYETGDEIGYFFCPLVVDNIAYVAAKEGALIALDAATGRELWAHKFGTGGR